VNVFTQTSKAIFITAVVLGAITVRADENGENIIYLGSGAAKTASSTVSGATPGSIGYIRISNTADNVWGLDFGGEGTKLDSTWGRTGAVGQANSYNLLLGKNISKSEAYRFDATALIGIRESTASCPKSYLGYQCYADAKPDTQSVFNYGVVLTLTYKSFMLGARATSESTQAFVGYRF